MIEQIKRDYLKRILEMSLNNQKYSTVVFRASFCLDEIKGILEELKEEYHIDNMVFLDFDLEKINAFFASNPSDEEIDRFIPRIPKASGRIKIIHFSNDCTDVSEEYCSDYPRKYYDLIEEYNKELSSVPKSCQTVVACPNKKWAEYLLGSQEQLEELWKLVPKALLSLEETKKEVKERIRRKDELNKMKIHNLSFYTTSGTDFRIALNRHSLWVCEPNSLEGVVNFFNYPSYEIYTSPDSRFAEGKIVLSKKRRFYYGIMIENAIFNFSAGKLISTGSDNKKLDSILKYEPNKMNRIGEIALVSQDSPLAKTKMFYDMVLFDENSGCHFALGDSIKECMKISEENLKKKGVNYYHYNSSEYHIDFIFGDDSLSVEAETNGKQKVLLMENGRWKI